MMQQQRTRMKADFQRISTARRQRRRSQATMAARTMLGGNMTTLAMLALLLCIQLPFAIASTSSLSSSSDSIPFAESQLPRRRRLQDDDDVCFENEILTAEYNTEPAILAHPGMMFNIASRDKPVKISAVEVDVRVDLLGFEENADSLGIQIYACLECPQDEDFFRNFYYTDERFWTLIADVNLIRHPTDTERFLVPAHSFQSISLARTERMPLFIKTTSGNAWMDNTVNTFVKSGDMTSGVTSGSSNLSLFAGYATTSAGPFDTQSSNGDGINYDVTPIFSGKFHLSAETNFCGFQTTLETMVEFIHVMTTIPDTLDLTGLEEEVESEFVPQMLADDALLLEYTQQYQLRQDESKLSKAFFRPFQGTCPPEVDDCQAYVIRIFLKHSDLLTQRQLRAQVEKHAQYSTQLVEKYFAQSGGDDVGIFNAGYRSSQARFELTLSSSSNNNLSVEPDAVQLAFLEYQLTEYLRATLPVNFATVYETVIEQEGRRRERALRGQEEQRRILQTSRLQVSGYWQGGQFALEDEAEFGNRIRSAMQAVNDNGDNAFLEVLRFEVNLPGRDMEFNERHVLFKGVDELQVSVDSENFAIPIVWVEGREREDELAGLNSGDDSGVSILVVIIVVVLLLIALAIGLGVARYLQLRHQKKLAEQKQREKDEGIDDHSDYFCNNYNNDYLNEMEVKKEKWQEKRNAEREKGNMTTVMEEEHGEASPESPVSSGVGDIATSSPTGNSATTSEGKGAVVESRSPAKKKLNRKKSRSTTPKKDSNANRAESPLKGRRPPSPHSMFPPANQSRKEAAPPVGMVIVPSDELDVAEDGKSLRNRQMPPLQGSGSRISHDASNAKNLRKSPVQRSKSSDPLRYPAADKQARRDNPKHEANKQQEQQQLRRTKSYDVYGESHKMNTTDRKDPERMHTSDHVLHDSAQAATSREFWEDEDGTSVSSSSSDGFYSSAKKSVTGLPSLSDHIKSKPTPSNSSSASVPWSSRFNPSPKGKQSAGQKGDQNRRAPARTKSFDTSQPLRQQPATVAEGDTSGQKRWELHRALSAERLKVDKDKKSDDSSSISSSSSDGFYSSAKKSSVEESPSMSMPTRSGGKTLARSKSFDTKEILLDGYSNNRTDKSMKHKSPLRRSLSAVFLRSSSVPTPDSTRSNSKRKKTGSGPPSRSKSFDSKEILLDGYSNKRKPKSTLGRSLSAVFLGNDRSMADEEKFVEEGPAVSSSDGFYSSTQKVSVEDSSSVLTPDSTRSNSKRKKTGSGGKPPSRSKSFDSKEILLDGYSNNSSGQSRKQRKSPMRRSLSAGGLRNDRYIIDEEKVMAEGLAV
mmetsp:Transcript_29317/g.80528  ORF Transcript_29317/g.80528 Transcript_29317/m.80528 type:complete len:1320 (-) Transcript_29317:70-4029(-)